ncbi:DNA-3-methyladenine glycosylase 2 family protein [uncultured Psychrobacter sp.]|uniref:DNA-3-methyladenine glycosylase family protein n=1 Tax=uncultured Psychrobacter sp. TaxID=259303 RepID=UPI00260652DF|nr:DNA-3-methyladenine glycosylase 2 family protein [uncultured Psychrobacter sp.]
MSMTTLDSSAELKTHIQALIELEPRFAPVYEQVGVPSLRRNEGGFAALLRAIVGQQLSVAAASSIWQRLVDADLITPKTLIQADDDDLRAQGLSRQKIRYVRSLVDHDIDYQALTTMSDGEVIATLTAVTGIGRWTAEMYLLFSLGRADILAVDDLAIRVAAMALLELPERPTPKQLKVATQSWSPYLSAASLLLWSYYGQLRNKTAVPI